VAYDFSTGVVELVLLEGANEPLNKLLPPFRNIRCFSFVKKMYLDIF
jgi:hypothetical protein